MRLAVFGILGVLFTAGACAAGEIRGHLDTEGLPPYLSDRGEGLRLSMFGTYIQKGQLVVYPFFEYYHDSNAEYAPVDLGHKLDQDFRGKYQASEELIFLAYGVNDWLAFEMEAAMIQARLEKSSQDPSSMPSEIEESGLGDVEGQLRWRWAPETQSRPEFFSYFETVIPTQDEGALIGTTDWEFKLGAGATRGYSWGTMTLRAAAEYGLAEETLELGEVAIEYLKRVSSEWRVTGGFEGTQDEVELITEAQWHFARNGILKLNNSFGVTSKATDWAPEVGLMFSFP